MTLKEICIDCLCVQLYKIRENAEHPQKIISLVDELLAEYDNTPEQACPRDKVINPPPGGN